MATSTEKAAAEFGAKKDQLSMPADKAAQAADLLKSARGAFSAIAAGPEPAPEPVRSENTGWPQHQPFLIIFTYVEFW
jgi:hypothetical protein